MKTKPLTKRERKEMKKYGIELGRVTECYGRCTYRPRIEYPWGGGVIVKEFDVLSKGYREARKDAVDYVRHILAAKRQTKGKVK